MTVVRLMWIATAIAAVLAALVVLPSPSSKPWQAHLAVMEIGGPLALPGLVAMVIALRRARQEPGALLVALLALLCVALLLRPSLVAWRAARATGVPISWYEWTTWRVAPGIGVTRDVVLDPVRPDLVADIYHPATPGPHPLVLVLHGGSWRSGEKGFAAHVSRAIAAEGRVVADLRYRLAPEHRFPAAVADAKCALGRLRQQASRWDVDPARAVILGRSAGGQIAVIAAYSTGDARMVPSCGVGDGPVAGVISLYGPLDLPWGHANTMKPDIVSGSEVLELYLGGTPAQVPEAYRLASGHGWAGRPLPPTLLIHGTADRIVSDRHIDRLKASLPEAPVEELRIPSADHGFDARPGGFAEQWARHRILAFLRRVLG